MAEQNQTGEQHDQAEQAEARTSAFGEREAAGTEPRSGAHEAPAPSDEVRFERVDDHPRETGLRDPDELPAPSRQHAEELAARRSDDSTRIVARPKGVEGAEIAELEDGAGGDATAEATR